MTRCSSFIDGKPIFGSLKSQKSRPFPTFRYRTHLSNGLSEPLGESFSTMYRSGVLAIWKENYVHSKSTTTAIARIADLQGRCQSCNQQTKLERLLASTVTDGHPAAEVYINYRSRLKLVIRTQQVIIYRSPVTNVFGEIAGQSENPNE